MKQYHDERRAYSAKNWWEDYPPSQESTLCKCVYDSDNGPYLICLASCTNCFGYGIPPIALEEL